jgi:hypothetical protein
MKDLIEEFNHWFNEISYIAVTDGCHVISPSSVKFDHWLVSIHLYGMDGGSMYREFVINVYSGYKCMIHFFSTHKNLEKDYVLPFESHQNFYFGALYVESIREMLIKIEDKFGICIQDKVTVDEDTQAN